MYVQKNGALVAVSTDQIKKYADMGYSFFDNDYKPIDDPMKYATDKPPTISLSLADLMRGANQTGGGSV